MFLRGWSTRSKALSTTPRCLNLWRCHQVLGSLPMSTGTWCFFKLVVHGRALVTRHILNVHVKSRRSCSSIARNRNNSGLENDDDTNIHTTVEYTTTATRLKCRHQHISTAFSPQTVRCSKVFLGRTPPSQEPLPDVMKVLKKSPKAPSMEGRDASGDRGETCLRGV